MGIIRGKIDTGLDFYPFHRFVGDPIWEEKDGKWFDKDGNEVQVETMSLKDLMAKVSESKKDQ